MLEMSRYIDLDMYHEVERSHPYYTDMVEKILACIEKYHQKHSRPLNILELGAGTGLFTEDLIKKKYLNVDALEIDSNSIPILEKHVLRQAHCIQGDATIYCREGFYDLVCSTFAHDHIHFNLAETFVQNIRRNLKKGGLYLMGGEILPYFETEEQRCQALHAYHGFIIEKANREGHFALAQIEISALRSGIEMVGDFKRHELMFEQEMLKADFTQKVKIKMGPRHKPEVGGVFVYIYEAT